MVRTSSKWGKFGLSSWIWPWRSTSISPQNIRDLNQGPNLMILAWTPGLSHGQASDWHRQTDRRTDRQTDRQTHPTIPEGQNWPRVIKSHILKPTSQRSLTLWEINSSPPNAAYMRQRIGSALVQIMACCLFSAKPLFKPKAGYRTLRNKLQ